MSSELETDQKSSQESSVSDEQEQMRLTQVELLKMETFSAITRATKAEALYTGAVKRALLQQIDPKNQLAGFDFQLAGLERERAEAQKNLEQLRAGIEARLGIDLKKYAYDDVTGTLRELPDDMHATETKKE